jgi:5-(carboxyamino)imidazole ribonucleotide mutase
MNAEEFKNKTQNKSFMEKALVIFGSGTDSPVFEALLENLKKQETPFKLRVLSAHKTPLETETAVRQSNEKIFICGAGLAAALPGATAALTTKPVIGIPCKGAFEGMDAMLSIFQMPPGIPVIGVGVEQVENAAELAHNFLSKKIKKITLLLPETETEKILYEKTKTFLKETETPFEENKKPQENAVNILFKDIQNIEALPETTETILVVPAVNRCSHADAQKLLNASKKHYWVGLNNYRNATIAALQLINITGELDEKLKKIREQNKQKVLEADKKHSCTG